MDLDRVTASLRPRDAWEGQDLGFALARTWFLPLWLLWWASAAPLAILCLPLTGLRPDLWLLAVWWLKPLYEGPLLVWASRALFGERLGRGDLRSVLREGLPRRLLPYLLWRRIGMRRSFLMPLTLLEGLSGSAARQRRQVMSNGSGVPFWLTLACYHFEIVLWLGLLLGLFFMVPDELPRLDLLAVVTDEASWAYWVSVLVYALAFSLIAPFYVCAGFALYLSRRTELEAWDLELAFKRARPDLLRDAGAGPGPSARIQRGVSAAILLIGLGLLPGPGTEAAVPADPETARTVIDEILASPDFGSVEEVRIWVPIERDETERDSLEPPEGLKAILLWIARSVKWLLLALAVVGLALLLAKVLSEGRARGWLRQRVRRPRPLAAPTHAPLERHDLPADIAGVVRALLREGDRRGALSLLYRACLEHLVGLGLEIPDGATEQECLRLASRHLSEASLAPLARITRAWQGFAYAHRLPSEDSLESLVDAWSQWVDGLAARPSP